MPDHEGTALLTPEMTEDESETSLDGGGGWGVQLSAALDVAIGKLSDSITTTMRDEFARQRRQARGLPALVKISSVFTYTTAAGAIVTQQGGTGIGVLLGGPEVGRQWNVRQIIVGGTTITANPAGTVWLMVAAAPPNELSLTSVVDFSTGLPSIATYSEDEVYVAPNENVWLVITGGTNATQYVASITYQESAFIPRETVAEI